MTSLYLGTGSVVTETVKSGRVVLVQLPGAARPVLTPTYAGQLSAGHSVLVTLGNSKVAAEQITPLLISELEAMAEGRLLEMQVQLEALESELKELKASSATRAQRFPEYAGWSLNSDGQLSGKDVDRIVKSAYDDLRREKAATSKVKEGIREYIQKGTTGRDVFLWLARNFNPVFWKYVRHDELSAEISQTEGHLQQLKQAETLNGLEQRLTEALAAIKKSGSYNPSKHDVGPDGMGIDVYQWLRQLTGAKPEISSGAYLLCEISRVIKGVNRKGVLVPFHFKAENGFNVPEEFRQHYLSTVAFITAIKVLNVALHKILLAYLQEGEAEHEGVSVPLKPLLQQLMPNNPAILALYGKDELITPDRHGLVSEIVRRAAERFKNGEMAKLAAKRLGMAENELSQESLEALVSTMEKVMPIVPVQFYELTPVLKSVGELRRELQETFQQISAEELFQQGPKKKLVSVLEKSYDKGVIKHNSLVKTADMLMQTLLEDFGVDSGKVPDAMAHIEDTIGLFGKEKVGFIKQVLANSERGERGEAAA